LKSLYTEMLCKVGFSLQEACKEVKKALQMCKEQGKKEGTADLPPNFGDLILIGSELGLPFMADRARKARDEGATDEDIREFWNLHDLQRRMVIWSE